jgi:hypothetical protein
MGGINVGALKGALGAEFFARGVSGFVKCREAPPGGGMGRLGFPSTPRDLATRVLALSVFC